mmetsp:Transcript_15294/g.24929  ORF Transcript_15294/g.24929 Transcript_15294/m.24929 type:complete len:265 (-) Transcript_15294:166-960(-)
MPSTRNSVEMLAFAEALSCSWPWRALTTTRCSSKVRWKVAASSLRCLPTIRAASTASQSADARATRLRSASTCCHSSRPLLCSSSKCALAFDSCSSVSNSASSSRFRLANKVKRSCSLPSAKALFSATPSAYSASRRSQRRHNSDRIPSIGCLSFKRAPLTGDSCLPSAICELTGDIEARLCALHVSAPRVFAPMPDTGVTGEACKLPTTNSPLLPCKSTAPSARQPAQEVAKERRQLAGLWLFNGDAVGDETLGNSPDTKPVG